MLRQYAITLAKQMVGLRKVQVWLTRGLRQLSLSATDKMAGEIDRRAADLLAGSHMLKNYQNCMREYIILSQLSSVGVMRDMKATKELQLRLVDWILSSTDFPPRGKATVSGLAAVIYCATFEALADWTTASV